MSIEVYGAVVIKNKEYLDNEILHVLKMHPLQYKNWHYAGDCPDEECDIFVTKDGKDYSFIGKTALQDMVSFLKS